jgi:hypothetical protein
MSIFALVWLILFLLFASFQINDPDPGIWVAVYVYAALLSLGVIFRRMPALLYLVSAVAFMIVGLVLFPGSVGEWIEAEEQMQSLEMKLPFIEEARESLGLIVCSLVCLAYFFHLRRLKL